MSWVWNSNEKTNTFFQNVSITINTAKMIPKLKLKEHKMFQYQHGKRIKGQSMSSKPNMIEGITETEKVCLKLFCDIN